MELGIHAYTLEDYNKNKYKISKFNYLVVGNYGCPLKAPEEKELFELKTSLGNEKVLHYISPKVPQRFVLPEFNKIVRLLEGGVEVTINDLGLFYLLKKELYNCSIYLGRMLTKSMGDSIWSTTLNKSEKEEVVTYFEQNNFNDDEKIKYFMENGVIGIEVNACSHSENSLQRISEKGLRIIGYADNKILAVSRSCPLRRLNQSQCSELCRKKLTIIPMQDKNIKYPTMELHGNTIVQAECNTFYWEGYRAIIYSV